MADIIARRSLTHYWRTVLACAALAVLPSCTRPTDATQVGRVTAVAVGGQIRITNGTAKPVFTFVIGRNSAALANWAPCVDPTLCAPLQPGARVFIGYPPSYSGSPEREALVYWWHSEPAPGGGWQADSIRALIVPLT